MTGSWKRELARFGGLFKQAQLLWLTQALRVLSMLAHGTYEPGGEDADDPVRLRRHNELTHRIASFMLFRLADDGGGPSDRDLFALIEQEAHLLGVDSRFLMREVRKRSS